MHKDLLYGLLMLMAAVFSLAVFVRNGIKKNLPLRRLGLASLLLVLLGFVLSKGLYLSARFTLAWSRSGWNSLWQLDPLSFALLGALMGCALAALLAAPQGAGIPGFFDALAMPLALFFVVSRFLGGMLTSGMGRFIQTEALCFVPFGICNEYGEWFVRLYLLEGLLALPALVYAWRSKAVLQGQRLALTIALLALPQLLIESLRLNSLKWGFVRSEQVIAAILGFVALLIACQKGRKTQVPALARWGLPLLYVALTGAAIGVEFMLDDGVGTPPMVYSLLALVTFAMVLTVFAAWFILSRADRRQI